MSRGRRSLIRLLASMFVGALLSAACSDSTDQREANLRENLRELVERGLQPSEAPTELGAFRPDDCHFESEAIPAPRCGWLTVPMMRHGDTAVADDRVVELHVATFPAWDERLHDDPIVYLEGGPGVPALDTADLTVDSLFVLNRHRDLILFDQRGLGRSEPALRCPEVDAAFAKLPADADEALSMIREREAASVCRDRLSLEGIDVSAFNTLAAAHDLEDLRVGLGHDQWNVLGVSYGTRLAQTFMREHPSGVRAVILDGAYPLDDDPLFSIPRTGVPALLRLFDDCRADETCTDRYGDIEARFRAMVAALNDEPAQVDFGDGVSSRTFAVTGDDVVDAAVASLYSSYSYLDIPRLVEVTERGELWALATFIEGPIGGFGDAETIGTFLSVNCRDEVAFSRTPEAVPQGALGGNDVAYVTDMLAACHAWNAGRAPEIENVNMTSDLPTLLLVGRFDPITPVEHARQVHESLTNSTLVEFRDRGHGTLLDLCASEIALAFVETPDAAVDTECTSGLAVPRFTQAEPGNLRLLEVSTETEPRLDTAVPAEWIATGDAWLRDRTVLDFTGLAFETASDTDAASTMNELEIVYDLTGSPSELDDGAGVTWLVHDTVHLSDHVDIAVATIDATTVIVTLTSGVEERSIVVETIWREVLASTRPR